jgi:hypothetical protein
MHFFQCAAACRSHRAAVAWISDGLRRTREERGAGGRRESAAPGRSAAPSQAMGRCWARLDGRTSLPMEGAVRRRRNGRSDSPDGPGHDRGVLRNGECRPLPGAPGGHGQHDGGFQSRRRARPAGSPAPAAGQRPAPAAADAATFVFSRRQPCVPRQPQRAVATLRGFPLAEVPAGLHWSSAGPRYATSDARATGKTGAADRGLNGHASTLSGRAAQRKLRSCADQ